MSENDKNSAGSLRHWTAWLPIAGLLVVMAATAMPLLLLEGEWYKYFYAAGALIVIAGKLLQPSYTGGNLRLKRLLRLEGWAPAFFAVGAFFLFFGEGLVGPTDWIAFTMGGAVIMAYASFMIPRQKR